MGMIYESENLYGNCKIDIENDSWIISAWYVDERYRNQGHGKNILIDAVKSIMRSHGGPTEIKYIWNGQNKYVRKWLERFNSKCMADINVIKNSPDDDWESHVYILDKDLFLSYCNIKVER